MSAKRNLVFDVVKLFAIFLVLWGHALPNLQGGHCVGNPVFLFIYSIHMPLFMTVCGFFSGSVMELSFKDFIVKKGRQLLLPAIVFWLPIAIGVWLKSGISMLPQSFDLGYWFLKCAFLCFLLFYVVARAVRPLWARVLITLAISLFIIPFQMDRMFPYFLFGILVRKYYHHVKKYSGTVALISGLIFLYCEVTLEVGVLASAKFSTVRVAFANGDGWLTLSYFLRSVGTGAVGSIFFISLFEYLSTLISAGPWSRKIASWGSKTLGIYLLQTLFIEILPKYLDPIQGMDFILYTFVVTPLISALVLVVCLACIKLLERSRWLSFLLLGRPMTPQGIGRTDREMSVY